MSLQSAFYPLPVVAGTTAGTYAEGNDSRLHTRSHTITSASDHTAGAHKVFYSDGSGNVTELALGASGEVLTSNGAAAAPSFAAASGGISAVGASTDDVLSVSGSDLIADDGGLIDSSDPFIKWDDAAGKLVYANPLRRTAAGAFYVGLAPTTTALGTNAVNIQPDRTNATYVAGGTSTVAIGRDSRTANNEGVAIGNNTLAGSSSVAIGTGAQTFTNPAGAIAIGRIASAGGIAYPIAIGGFSNASQENAIAIGANCDATAPYAVGIGQSADIGLRGGFMTRPFGSVYWGGQTTNGSATVLNLDATATNPFTIAANTALIADIFLIARLTDNTKFLSARRSVAIYRDNANVTALIGDVQTLGNDQSFGSPTWSIAITADNTTEALQLEVTGATGETINWRATAFYRVV